MKPVNEPPTRPGSRVLLQPMVTVPNLSTWSVSQVLRALREHEDGNFQRSAWLFEALERSPQTNAALNRRILTMLGLPFRLEAGTGDGRRNDANVARIRPYWHRIASRRYVGKSLRTTLGLGVAFARREWTATRDGQWLPKLRPWHPSLFYWSEPQRCYFARTLDGVVEVRQGEDDWAIMSYDEWDDRPWQRGIVRCLGINDTVRALAVRDWARFSEVHGIPMRLAEVPEDADDEDKRDFVSDLENPGSEITIIAPKGKDEQSSFSLSLIEAKDQAFDAFAKLIKQCDGDAALAITGTTMVNTSGVYEAKDNSEGVRRDYTEADACMVSEYLHEQAARPWAEFNLGAHAADTAPRPCYDPDPPTDKKITAETFNALGDGLQKINAEARTYGKRLVIDEIAERFDLEFEDEPHGTIDAVQQAQPPPAPGPGATPGAAKPPSKGRVAASAAEAQRGLLEGQAYVDEVHGAALQAAPEALSPVLAALMAELSASSSYDDLRTRLVKLATGSGVKISELRQLLASSASLAQVCGLWSVER
jgi:phage gp29-like protein